MEEALFSDYSDDFLTNDLLGGNGRHNNTVNDPPFEKAESQFVFRCSSENAKRINQALEEEPNKAPVQIKFNSKTEADVDILGTSYSAKILYLPTHVDMMATTLNEKSTILGAHTRPNVEYVKTGELKQILVVQDCDYLKTNPFTPSNGTEDYAVNDMRFRTVRDGLTFDTYNIEDNAWKNVYPKKINFWEYEENNDGEKEYLYAEPLLSFLVGLDPREDFDLVKYILNSEENVRACVESIDEHIANIANEIQYIENADLDIFKDDFEAETDSEAETE
ncbi:hypothetical protein PCE1_004192 [Barthelona sp. PCE]